ncbi:RNA polymerase factor sigma-32 [Pelagibius litoralis]|uniref:RNA polymerase sigma factor n=1 Tax=Pelagibius litoralis TaxID=374515 RepID=A0A967KF44_9PROT|nr:RNA polymerase factor sigma-32 [Pelagibius litoralis]NIA71085.1 RNA polymerase factor sigma-32 [Pelagibius litoralis]
MPLYEDSQAQRSQARFIRQSMSERLLSREEEYRLARSWRDDGDADSLHELIRAYTRLVVSLATKFRNYGLPMGDLIQEGTIGLLQAASRFEPERNVRFSTYASWWIRSAMQDFILRNWSIVRTGTTAAQKTLFFNFRRLRARIEDSSGRPFDEDGRVEVAKHLSVPLHDVNHMESRLSASDQSLNARVGEDGDDEWQDHLTDDRSSPEDLVISFHDSLTRSEWIEQALLELSQREQTIIRARRLSDDSKTLEDLGKDLGVSKERVRQLEQRALQKMKALLLDRVKRPLDLLADA